MAVAIGNSWVSQEAYDYVKKQGYNIDAIVYLPLEKTKEPDKSDWTDEDKEK